MENIENIILLLESKVKELSEYQKQRQADLISQTSKFITDQIDTIQVSDQLSKPLKAKLAYFKGRALASHERYEKSAEEFLSKSVKLDPRNSEAWNWLGEVFYFKKDYQQSKRCFEGSLEQSGPNKETLRKLSIVHRFLTEDRKEAVIKSIDLAKQALMIDFNDWESWYILANAHLTNYFTNNPSYEELEKALKSYTQAESFLNTENPDLLFNKALALNAAERHSEAFAELLKANTLDFTLNANKKLEEFYESLKIVANMIEKKCNIKRKNLTSLCKSIPIALKNTESFVICSISELVIGQNLNKMLSLKILGYSKSEFPPVFIGCDSKASFFGISIYNYPSQTKIVLGCSVFITNPIMIEVNRKDIRYFSIQVRDPNSLMINRFN